MKNKLLDIIFALKLVLFCLIITGVLPREAVFLILIGLVIYSVFASLEDGAIFFVRSIPFFIAIPIMPEYDNLNIWRILSIVLFLKLIHVNGLKYFLNLRSLSIFSKLLLILLGLSMISLIPAIDKISAMTRVIYFINLSLIGIVVHILSSRSDDFKARLIKNIAIPTIIVVIVGYIQLASTYFIDIYQFMRIWGEGIQMRQFGVLWSEIAVKLGNTWFAYYGDQLSLRVFSLFPDSHSFPQFVLLGIPALFAVSILKLAKNPHIYTSLKLMTKTRVSLNILWVAAAFLIIILSGTRGIWAASLGVLLIISGVVFWMKKSRVSGHYKNIFKFISLYMLAFFMLFAVAYPIFVSPQFLVAKTDNDLFKQRIKSVVDFGETSNNQRLEIWRASFESIMKRPFWGVGIGNFPVVLDQRIFLARAGSSAHNIYLHIAAEMGLPALFVVIVLMWLVFKKTYQNFIRSTAHFYNDRAGKEKIIHRDSILLIYHGAMLIFLPWVLIYSLTDIALFDERTFLLFITTIALIMPENKKPD